MSDDQDRSSDIVSELAELARETRERREHAVEESARPRPKFIETVDSSEVLYTFRPSAIPFRQVDIQHLNDWLQDQYAVRLADPDFSPLLTKISRDQLAQMDETELLRRLVREANAQLTWEDGRFPLRDDFVPITSIGINFESIDVSVAGLSQVAEVIAREVLEAMWTLAGSKKSFADLQSAIQLVAYQTGTRLNLDHTTECLLNPGLIQFFDANLAIGNKYAASMGRTAVSPDKLNEQINAVAAIDDLTIHISRFNPTTGSAEDSNLRFSVMAKSDYRSGRVRVISELPYDQHVEFLASLFKVVGGLA